MGGGLEPAFPRGEATTRRWIASGASLRSSPTSASRTDLGTLLQRRAHDSPPARREPPGGGAGSVEFPSTETAAGFRRACCGDLGNGYRALLIVTRGRHARDR